MIIFPSFFLFNLSATSFFCNSNVSNSDTFTFRIVSIVIISCLIYPSSLFFSSSIYSPFSPIMFNESLEDTIDLSTWNSKCFGEKINYLEHVEVYVNLTYTRRGDLLIKLTSPQGTVSSLTHYRTTDSHFKNTDFDFVFMTLHHWGENAVGKWTLTLENSRPHRKSTGWLLICNNQQLLNSPFVWCEESRRMLSTEADNSLQDLHNFYSFINSSYYSFKIFFRFWLAKIPRIIQHNQVLSTKFWKILRHVRNDVSCAA